MRKKPSAGIDSRRARNSLTRDLENWSARKTSAASGRRDQVFVDLTAAKRVPAAG